ncbi:Lrp/AsnC ligand binding domain-containing protein [uncultured Cytophaga sp.]|uniref:Lrp/AsnC ligand binding domain-containing protein n=1 Tax=uncultured Cytophaga sp. TaxID=160238 RepID=UPI00261A3A05|nr:Lrp/AsnC ligand binding domain-containing protein [uncultured Cytophaga sp.]
MAIHSEIDSVDLNILSQLVLDASIPYTEIAKNIGVSGGTIHVRMKKMMDLGIVKGSHLDINYTRLGYDITAFLGIYLDKSEFYDKAVDDLRKIPEVVNVHYTTGNFSMFVKIICRDTQHLREVLHDKIQKVYGIQRTETSISLEESINRTLELGH